ncbi:MAG: UvrD-helicase domain-containing protein, partial [Limisphaerales bacterium]
MSLTETQVKAVAARGNVVLVAGAGTGKTHTLVERCLACLVREEPRASLDELLMVTFTEAAAAEMRQRIRARLEQQAASQPGEAHWQEQIALFETANIGTLHSFCLKLIREHFYLLQLDPQLSVLAAEEAQLLANETLEELLRKHYGGKGTEAVAVQQLIQSQGRGWDKPIRGLMMRLYHYTQSLPDPAGWIRGQLDLFSNPAPTIWQEWLMPGAVECLDRWQPILKTLAAANGIAAKCAALLGGTEALDSRSRLATLLDRLAAERESCPNGKKIAWLKPLERFFKDVRFLRSVAGGDGKPDPLDEDWTWVRTQMLTLVGLTQEFAEAFAEAKHELGVGDFHDL